MRRVGPSSKSRSFPFKTLIWIVGVLILYGSAVSVILGEMNASHIPEDMVEAVVVPPAPTLRFDDFHMESLKGVGSVNVAFQGKIPKLGDGDYIMKVSGDDDLHFSDTESEAFRLLMKPPMNPSIPPLIFHEPSMCKFCRT